MDALRTIRQRLFEVPPLLGDAGLTLALTAFMEIEGGLLVEPEGGFTRSPLLNAVALLMTVPLLWRRRMPLTVLCLILMGVLITFSSGVTAHPPLVWGAIVAILIAAYSVGAYSRYSLPSLAVLLITATAIVAAFGGGLPPPPDFAVPYAVLLLPWLVGLALRNRQMRADVFEERAMRLEREGEFTARAARAEERARIARELHDVVAHSVSVMVVQAGAARHVLDTSREEAVDALLAVESTGREAMSELRALLGVLSHEDDNRVALNPQPGMGEVDSLVARVADAGLPVELQVRGEPRPLSPGVDLAAYRILQEALTNALKHSGLAPTTVILEYRQSDLKIEILDDGQGAVAGPAGAQGRGLAGMQQRVSLYGGRLEVGPRLERGYAVRVWLPLREDAQ